MSSVNNNRIPIYEGQECMGYSDRSPGSPNARVTMDAFQRPQPNSRRNHFFPFAAAVLLKSTIQYLRNRRAFQPKELAPSVQTPPEVIGLPQTIEPPPVAYGNWIPEDGKWVLYGSDGKQIPYPRPEPTIQTAPAGDSPSAKSKSDNLEIDRSKTKNEELKDLQRDIQEKREVKEKMAADPQASQDQKKQAKEEYDEAVEKALEFEYANKDPLKNPSDPPKNLREKIDQRLEKIEKEATAKGEKGKAKLSSAKQNNQTAAKLQKGADKLRKELFSNPNAKEITVNTSKGPVKFTREEAINKMNALEGKAEALKGSAKTQFREGAKEAPAAVKGKMTSELRKQAQHLPNAVKTTSIINGADAIFDVLEGKADVDTAVKNAVSNTITGVGIQAVGSVAVEGLKEAVTIVSPQLAENIPCVGTFITVGNAMSAFNSAPTTEEGLKNVGYMGLDAAGEFAAISALTAATGGTSIPVIIGAKFGWRATKYLWNWALSDSPSVTAKE